MNTVFLSILFACSACKKKPIEKPPEPVITEKPEPKPEPKIEVEPEPDPIVERLVANFQKVYFELNSSDLNDDSRAALDENISIMLKEPNLSIEIQGHADERGTTEYNVSLGQKRGTKISQYFTMQGISSSRIKVISFGEERPAVQGTSEAAWSKNRRCEFVIIRSDNPNIKGTVE